MSLKLNEGSINYSSEDDLLNIKVSKEGISFIGKASYEALEEDLISIPNEFKKPREEIRSFVNKGATAVLERYGKYINPEVLEKLAFTDSKNILVEDRDNYYQVGNVRVFVLNTENFNMFEDAYKGSATRGTSWGSPVARELRSYVFGKELLNSQTETVNDRYLVLLKEPDDEAKYEKELTSVARHELMHTLGFGNLFPSYMTEGVVHYYQGEITGKPPKTLSPQRQEGTKLITHIIEKLKSKGMSDDEVNMVFVGSDKEMFDKAVKTFGDAYGDSIAKRIFSGNFKSLAEANATLDSLDSGESSIQ